MPRLLDLLVGGWTVSGIGTYQSGLPAHHQPSLGPDGQGAACSTIPTPERWFDTTAFAPAAPFTFGNVSRTQPDLRTDSTRNIDLTLGKYVLARAGASGCRSGPTPSTCSTRRASAPRMATSRARLFGTVTAQANNPREIQLGVKLYW